MKRTVSKTVLLTFVLTLTFLITFAAVNIPPAAFAWESSTPEAQGIDSRKLAEMLDFIPNNNYGVHSVLVIRNGYLVAESSYYPYEIDQLHLLNSVTKNITSALVGLALEHGYLESLEQKIINFFPEFETENMDERKQEITIADLLTMKSGLQWSENGPPDMQSHQGMMSSDNTLSYILNSPMEAEPGERFNYSSGDSHLLSAIITRATGVSTENFAREYLFEPLEISEYYWMRDPQGYNHGGTRLYLKPKDLARFGHVYLRKGRWNGKQIIPAEWIKESLYPHVNNYSPGYGYHWWLNDFGGLFTEQRQGFSGNGFGGQYMFMVPELDLMVVFLSGLKVGETLDLVFERKILNAVSESPIPENEEALALLEETRRKHTEELAAGETADLPGWAQKVSGRRYVMDNADSFTFDFSREKEAVLLWQPAESETRELLINLEQHYSKNHLTNYFYGEMDSTIALQGRWEDQQTFIIEYRPLEHSTSFEYIFTFSGDEIKHERKVMSSGRISHESSGKAE